MFFGPFDDMFDFDGSGDLDAFEKAVQFEFMEESEREESGYDDDDDDDY